MTNEEMLTILNQRFDEIGKRLDGIEERLAGIEEEAAVTREGVNSILEWADIAGRTINVRLVE